MDPDLQPGARWLRHTAPLRRKQLGQWSTPWWLAEAVAERVCAALPTGGLVVDPACGDGRWLVAVARARPDARLVGLDIDPAAIEAARATLRSEGVEAHLECCDALAEGAVPRADLIVGNPPFVRPQNLPRAVREDVWRRFSVATDKCDLYACFVERCLDRAPRVALVLPNTWLSMHSFGALRSRITAAGVELIAELPGDCFDAAVRPVVLVCDPADARSAGTWSPGGLELRGAVHRAPDAWSLEGPLPSLPGAPLGSVATVHMGVVCGDYARYVHRGRTRAEDRPTCRGRDVRRWHIASTDEHVWYVPRDMLDRKPYVAPKSAELFDRPEKVVLAGTTGTELRAAMDRDRRFPLDSCYVVLPRRADVDPYALLGILLSRQAGDWYAARHPAPRVKGVEVARIPVPSTGWGAIAEAARAADPAALEVAVRDAYAATGRAGR